MRASSKRFEPTVRVAALVVCGSLLLAACGKSAHPTTSTTTTTTAPKRPVSTAHPCSVALLGIDASFGGAAAGGSFYRFSVTNTSPHTCTVSGYPVLSFFAPGAAGGAGAGSPVPLTATDAGRSSRAVILAPGHLAEFLLAFTDVPVNGGGCATVASVEVRLPHATSSVPVPITFAPCGGAVRVYALAAPGTESP